MGERREQGAEAMVERWRALLTAGVPLRIPETPIAYCDTERSTLRWLGWETFERCDVWSAEEMGHGRYGSTASTELSRGALDAALGRFAAGDAGRVVPCVGEVAEAEREAPGEVLARVRRGEIALTGWYEQVEGGVTDAVVGDGAEVYWVRRQGAKPVRVERLDGDLAAVLEGLPIARSAMTTATAEHAAMARRAGEHLARHAALLGTLAADPTRYVGRADAREGTARGSRFAWINFWDAAPGALPMVVDQRAYATSWAVAHALFEDPKAEAGALDATQREVLSRAEAALGAVYDALLGGATAYQRNTSVAAWWAWVDGVGYEVTVDQGGAPIGVERSEEVVLPAVDCASRAQKGTHGEKFHALDEAWRAALRARIAG